MVKKLITFYAYKIVNHIVFLLWKHVGALSYLVFILKHAPKPLFSFVSWPELLLTLDICKGSGRTAWNMLMTSTEVGLVILPNSSESTFSLAAWTGWLSSMPMVITGCRICVCCWWGSLDKHQQSQDSCALSLLCPLPRCVTLKNSWVRWFPAL